MGDMDHSEAMARFSSVTGADLPTAEHFLVASNWDLNNSINFYVESGAAVALEADPVAAVPSEHGDQPQDGGGLQNLADPFADQGPRGPHSSTQATSREDDDLQAALAASLHTGVAPSRQTVIEVDDGEELDDADLRVLAEHRQTSHAQPLNLTEEGLPRPTRGRRSASAVAMSGNFSQGAADPDLEQELAAMGVPNPLSVRGSSYHIPPRPQPLPDLPAAFHSSDPDVPAGINLEEARMLEAAMMGLPYTGRMPDFSQPASRQYPDNSDASPLSPSVRAQRQLRQEQDDAFHQSLQADRQKANAEQQAAEALRKSEQAKVAAAEEEAARKRQYERQLADKQAGLPPEPEVSDADSINVLVRMPNGSRIGRRFTRGARLAALFDYIDVQARAELKADTYRLVTQYPRRVFSSGMAGSLQDAGLTQKQEAVFLELL